MKLSIRWIAFIYASQIVVSDFWFHFLSDRNEILFKDQRSVDNYVYNYLTSFYVLNVLLLK